MLGGDVSNEFLDEHGLADARAAEEADLAALRVWSYQVYYLDARLEHARHRTLVLESRRRAMDGHALGGRHLALPVYRIAGDVEHAPEGFLSDRYRQRPAGIDCVDAPRKPVRRRKGDAPDEIVPEMQEHLGRDLEAP